MRGKKRRLNSNNFPWIKFGMDMSGEQPDPKKFTCAHPGCGRHFKKMRDLKSHNTQVHRGMPVRCLQVERRQALPVAPRKKPKQDDSPKPPPPPSSAPPIKPSKNLSRIHRKGGRRRGVPHTQMRLIKKLDLGKGYAKTPVGKKKKYLDKHKIPKWKAQRYARLWKEYSTFGTIEGRTYSVQFLRERVYLQKGRRGKWHEDEERLYEWFLERRRNGVRVSGLWLRAKMIEFVEERRVNEPNIHECKGNQAWLGRFCKRWEVSYQQQTNKKSRSSIARSVKVRNFHWYAMYQAPLEYSKRHALYKPPAENERLQAHLKS